MVPTSAQPIALPTHLRFAFIEASWHADIVHQARDAFFATMAEAGVGAERIDLFDVAGAFEIPLHAQCLAKSGRYAAIVGSALVADDGTLNLPKVLILVAQIFVVMALDNPRIFTVRIKHTT